MRLFQFFKHVLTAPLLLLLRAEGDSAPPADQQPAEPQKPDAKPDAKPAPAQPSAKDVATELMKALDARSQRLEGSIAKSIAEKYGRTEDEVNKILSAEKKKRDEALPASVQKQLDAVMKAANDKLITAEIRVQAAALGFVDSDDALALVDRSKIAVDDKGDVTGVEDALKALAEKKPHLIKQSGGSGAWGERHGAGAGSETTARDEMKSKLFGGNK